MCVCVCVHACVRACIQVPVRLFFAFLSIGKVLFEYDMYVSDRTPFHSHIHRPSQRHWKSWCFSTTLVSLPRVMLVSVTRLAHFVLKLRMYTVLAHVYRSDLSVGEKISRHLCDKYTQYIVRNYSCTRVFFRHDVQGWQT